jgi:integrase
MSPLLKTELRKQYMQAADKVGLIFQTREGTPLNPSNVYNRLFCPAVKAAEIGEVVLHDLRHTFGSWKIAHGGGCRLRFQANGPQESDDDDDRIRAYRQTKAAGGGGQDGRVIVRGAGGGGSDGAQLDERQLSEN